MTGVNQFEWRELNSRRNYPFTDESTLIAGSVAVPKEWALDASLSPNKAYESAAYFYISKFSKNGNDVTATLSSQKEEVATATFDIKSPASHIKFYNKVGGRYAGSLIVNPAYSTALGSLETGDTRVQDGRLRFVPSVVNPVPFPSVTSVVASTGGPGLAGEVHFTGGDGVTLKQAVDKSDQPIPNVITVNIDGDPNFARVDCEPEQAAYIVEELRGIVPCTIDKDGVVKVGHVVESDDQGNFTITASDAFTNGADGDPTNMYSGDKPTLRIYPKGGSLFFEIAGLARRLSS